MLKIYVNFCGIYFTLHLSLHIQTHLVIYFKNEVLYQWNAIKFSRRSDVWLPDPSKDGLSKCDSYHFNIISDALFL